ncbi:MAG: phage baseplate assembly protein V [Longimicrobiales bacterium]
MIEEVLEAIGESIADVKQKFYGVVTGQVINPVDPLMLGRVQVRLPFLDALDLSPWARVAVPMAGMLHGMYFIPNLGDEVLVAFEHGDVNAPYIIGSLWTAMAPPPLPTPLPQIRAIRTLAGNQIVFTELPPSITIQTAPTAPEVLPTPPSPVGPHNSIKLAPDGVETTSPTTIRLQVGSNLFVISQAGITMTAGGSVVGITPDGVTIAGAKVTIAAGEVSVLGGVVKINS